jgi:small-conductance mechanosensitive channel
MPIRTQDPPSLLAVLGLVLGAGAVALLAASALHLVTNRMAQRSALTAELSRRTRRPVAVTLVFVAMYAALHSVRPARDWQPWVEHTLFLALIGSVAWLVTALSFVIQDAAIMRYRVDVRDNRHARRVRTQISVVRRVTVAAVTVLAVGAMLMTYPSARTAGTSLLASAGVISVVAGLAAQSTLSNLIAGVQLAFTDWLRLDDVVVVEEEWGRVEDITLSYVVLHLWDDRRLVFPTSYFTQKPFQNWTRSEAALLGTVLLDVDWAVPVDAMRDELRRIVEQTDLWDGRVSVLQVTDAVNGFVQVRALVSAVDAPTSWDLRCHVRERLVAWLQSVEPAALPRLRLDLRPARPSGPAHRPEPSPDGQPEEGAKVFSGGPEGEERGAEFAPPRPEAPPARNDPAH